MSWIAALLLALGAPSLIQAMLNKAEREGAPPSGAATPAQPIPPSAPSTRAPTPPATNLNAPRTAATVSPVASPPNAAVRH